MAQATSKTNGSDAEQLQQELAALREDFGALSEHVRQIANGAVHDAGSRLRDTATSAASAAKQKGQAGAAALEHQVQAHPFAALLIAFGVGVAASRFMSRD